MTRAVKPPALFIRRQAGKHPVADAGGARLAGGASLRLRRDDDARRASPFLVPLDRHPDRLALIVDPLDESTVTEGRSPGVLICLRRPSIRPSSAMSFSSASVRSAVAPVMLKARAISRLPILPDARR